MQFNPGDYTIEKLGYAKDFTIYPPVDANFKFKTLGDDDDPNFKPGDYHVIRGNFDNNRSINKMNFRSRPLRGGINGIPKNNRLSSKSSRFEPSNRPYPRDEEGHD
jgi:hypothetical protein